MSTLPDEQEARKYREEDLRQEGHAEGENKLNTLMAKLFSLNLTKLI